MQDTQSAIELTPNLGAEEVAHRLRHAGDGIGARWRELSFYLLEMKKRELYLVHGYRNTQHFAEAQLDLEARRCNELIRAESC